MDERHSIPAPGVDADTYRGSFLSAAWANRRFTRNSASLLLGVLGGFFAWSTLTFTLSPLVLNGLASLDGSGASWIDGIPFLEQAWSSFVLLLPLAYFAGSALLYPFAREAYYRATRGAREAVSGVFVFGGLFLLTLAFRVATFVVLWAVAIPVGLLAAGFLGASERRGNGWRFDA